VDCNSFAAHAEFWGPGREVDGFCNESGDVLEVDKVSSTISLYQISLALLHTSNRSHTDRHVRLIRRTEGWGLGTHPRNVKDIATLAMVTCITGDQGPWQSARLEAFVKDAAHEHSVLDVAFVMPQPTQGCRPLPVQRVVGWSKMWWPFELCRCKASDSSGYSCFDQVDLVGASDC